MRGADGERRQRKERSLETSPHAWSRCPWLISSHPSARNISTCVEQIARTGQEGEGHWKHLHMRGADHVGALHPKMNAETSPHAWSRSRRFTDTGNIEGNISTCVEQISPVTLRCLSSQKHLHMRGADNGKEHTRGEQPETSPHAWSRLICKSILLESKGNISTCVEQIWPTSRSAAGSWKHLHMRGADVLISLHLGRVSRNISTCVEQITSSNG